MIPLCRFACGTRSITGFSRFTRQMSSNVDPYAGKPTLEIDPWERAKHFKRPISPHLSIYQPQLTWYMSAAHRITGAGLGGLFYGGSVLYAVFPFKSATVVAFAAASPVLLTGAKILLAAPFFYHGFNGLRHLMWDAAVGVNMSGVYTSGYAVLGLTALATLACL